MTVAGDNPGEDPSDNVSVSVLEIAVVSVEDKVCVDITFITFLVFSGRHLILASISFENYQLVG